MTASTNESKLLICSNCLKPVPKPGPLSETQVMTDGWRELYFCNGKCREEWAAREERDSG